MIGCVVGKKVGNVAWVVEAFSVYVVVATVRLPAKNPLPFTERSCPGVVVPMPTLPALEIDKRTVVGATPKAEPTINSREPRLVLPLTILQ